MAEIRLSQNTKKERCWDFVHNLSCGSSFLDDSSHPCSECYRLTVHLNTRTMRMQSGFSFILQRIQLRTTNPTNW